MLHPGFQKDSFRSFFNVTGVTIGSLVVERKGKAKGGSTAICVESPFYWRERICLPKAILEA
jgi:hypothetical protein